MVEISSRKELEDWLKQQPVEFSVVIAARAALRAATFAFDEFAVRKEANRTILLPIFRAAAAPWVAARDPNQGAKGLAALTASDAAAFDAANVSDVAAAAAALAASDAASAAAANAALASANASLTFANVALAAASDAALTASDAALAAASDAAFTASDAALTASDAAASDAAALWKQISADVSALENGAVSNVMASVSKLSDVANLEEGDARERSRRLAAQPLWKAPDGRLFTGWRRVEEVLRGEAKSLIEEDRAAIKAEDWDVWLTWYQRRIEGGGWKEALEVERVVSDEIPWDRWNSRNGIRDINAALRAIEDRHRIKARFRSAREVKVDPASGDLSQAPLSERPAVKENISPAGAVDNHANALRDLMLWQRAQASWDQEYRFLDFPFTRLARLLDQSPLHPDRIHDVCAMTVSLLEGERVKGSVSDSPETTQIVTCFGDAAHDIRFHYPDIAATHEARQGTTVPPTDEEKRAQLAAALRALESILEKDFYAELKADVDAIELSDAELPEGSAMSQVDLGERRRVAENLSRIWLILRDGGRKALDVVEDAFVRGKKLREYAKVAEDLDRIWGELRKWIMAFLENPPD